MASLVFHHASGSESSEVLSAAMYEVTSPFTSYKVGLFLSSVLKSSPNSSAMADFLMGGERRREEEERGGGGGRRRSEEEGGGGGGRRRRRRRSYPDSSGSALPADDMAPAVSVASLCRIK